MPQLIPVDNDPFGAAPQPAAPPVGAAPQLVPVDHDPFAATPHSGLAADVAKSGGVGLAKGAIGLAGLPSDLATMANQGIDAAENWIGQKLGMAPAPQRDYANTLGSANIQNKIEGVTGKFYEPQTTAGKYAQTIGEFAPGALGGPETLGARLLKMVVAPGIASEAAGQATEGTALEPYARVVGAVAGGALPAAVRGAGSVASGLRGSTANASPAAQELAAASARLGVDVPRIASPDTSLLAKGAGSALKEMPIVGTPLVKASEASIQGLGDAVSQTGAAYGSGVPLTAGEAAKTGLTDWITGGSQKVADRLYSNVGNLMNPAVKTPLTETQKVIGDIQARRMNAQIPGMSGAANIVQDAANNPAGLNFEGLKTLRSYVGELKDRSILPDGMDGGELNRIYGGLTQDLRASATNSGGPQGLSAFDNANNVFKLIAQRRETLAKIVGTSGDAAPERVLDRIQQMAGSKASADVTGLLQARKAIGPQSWDEVASAVIARMGRSPANPEFSGDRFSTAYRSLSDNGRQVLFGSTGKSVEAQSLKDAATVADAQKILQKYANPSGSGRVVSGFSMLGGLVNPITTIPTAATMAAGRVAAKSLAAPLRTAPPSPVSAPTMNPRLAALAQAVLARQIPTLVGASSATPLNRQPARQFP